MVLKRDHPYTRALSVSAFSLISLGMVWPGYAYVVKRSDTLSGIAHDKLGPPVYGKRGSLARIKGLNPQIDNENSIAIGQVIETQVKSLALDQAWDSDKNSHKILARSQKRKFFDRVPAAAANDENISTPEATAADETTKATAVAATATDSDLSQAPSDAERSAPLPQQPESHQSRFSQLSLEPTFSYLRIDGDESSNHSRGALLSSLNPGLRFKWFQNWSPDWQSFVNIETQRVKLQEPRTLSLVNAAQFYSGLSMGANYRATQDLGLGLELGLREEIFYRASSETSLSIDSVAVPYLKFSAGFDVIHADPYVVALGASVRLLNSVGTDFYSAKIGQGYRAFVALNELAEGSSRPKLGLALYFDYKAQNSAALNITQKSLGLDLNYFWGISR